MHPTKVVWKANCKTVPAFDADCRSGRLNAALDLIHDKFGSAALTTA